MEGAAKEPTSVAIRSSAYFFKPLISDAHHSLLVQLWKMHGSACSTCMSLRYKEVLKLAGCE